MFLSKLCVTTSHVDKMLKLCWTRTTNWTEICNFADQCKASVQLTAKCYYGSSTTDSSRRNIQVYYGNLTPQIRAVKIFSLLSSVAGLASQPILVHQMPNLGAPVAVALFGFVGFFTFVTPFLLHMITKKYVTHIYFNSDTEMYSAVCLNFFLRERMIIFTADEVIVPDVPGLFTSFQVKGSPLFVDPRLFVDPGHYRRIMGYDKPIDFKLNEVSAENMKSAGKKDTA